MSMACLYLLGKCDCIFGRQFPKFQFDFQRKQRSLFITHWYGPELALLFIPHSYKKTKTTAALDRYTQQKRHPLMLFKRNCFLQKSHMTNTPLEYGSRKNGALRKNCDHGILKSSFFHSRVIKLLSCT